MDVGHPHLKATGGSPPKFSFYAEGMPVLEVEGPETALVAYIGAHSVFNLKFGRGARGMAVYLQKAVGIDDGQKLTAKAIRFAKAE